MQIISSTNYWTLENTSYNTYKSVKEVALSSFYKWGNWGSYMSPICNLPRPAKLISAKVVSKIVET